MEGVRIAIVVSPGLEAGFLANTAAAVAIGLGAKMPGLAGVQLTDKAGRQFSVSSILPVPILQARPEMIRSILLNAIPPSEGGIVIPFPRYARSMHRYTDYFSETPNRDLANEEIDGLALAGPEKWVRSLTGSLKLFR